MALAVETFLPSEGGTHLLEIHCYSMNALVSKGKALDNLGRYPEAVTFYDRDLALNPNNTRSLTNKETHLDYVGKHEEAIVWYDKALGSDPNYTDARTTKVTFFPIWKNMRSNCFIREDSVDRSYV